ncbi:MAG: hypothetical protein ABSA92_06390 [Candidatus Bathyarchaeia archaeon]
MKASIDDSLVAVSLSVVALTIIGFLSFPTWNYIYSVSVAWVISDFILNLVIQGGQGWAKIPFFNNDFAAKGKSYLAFLFGIVVGTRLSSLGANIVFAFAGLTVNKIASNSTNTTVPVIQVIAANPSFFTLLLANVIVGCLVFTDLNVRFYQK